MYTHTYTREYLFYNEYSVTNTELRKIYKFQRYERINMYAFGEDIYVKVIRKITSMVFIDESLSRQENLRLLCRANLIVNKELDLSKTKDEYRQFNAIIIIMGKCMRNYEEEKSMTNHDVGRFPRRSLAEIHSERTI